MQIWPNDSYSAFVLKVSNGEGIKIKLISFFKKINLGTLDHV